MGDQTKLVTPSYRFRYTMTDKAVFARGPKRALICAKVWLGRASTEADPVQRLRMVYECMYALQRAERAAERLESEHG